MTVVGNTTDVPFGPLTNPDGTSSAPPDCFVHIPRQQLDLFCSNHHSDPTCDAQAIASPLSPKGPTPLRPVEPLSTSATTKKLGVDEFVIVVQADEEDETPARIRDKNPHYDNTLAPDDHNVLLVTSSVWVFFTLQHVRLAKGVLITFWGVVLFATLSALGFPLANVLPAECKEDLEGFFYSIGFFGILTSLTLPLWARAFFAHMLGALQQGLQIFTRPYDRELTIGVGCGLVGGTASALYGLHVAPPGTDLIENCTRANGVVRSSGWSWLVGIGCLSLLHLLHYQYLVRSRQKFMESRQIVLY